MANIRIPNLPNGRMVDENGNTSDEEQTFRQTLITSLQDNFGNEGCVIPSQTTANITKIQDNTYIDQATGNPVYTCKPGTFLYDSDTDEVKVSILVAGVPQFKVVTVS